MSEVEEGQEWLGVEDVARLARAEGIKRDSVHSLLSKSRRRAAQGGLRPFDLPLPDRRVKRPVVRRPPFRPVAVWTPQWRRESIDAWLAVKREDAAVKYAEVWARPHDPATGRFAPAERAS
jgi:hypothetical protein